MKKIISTLCMCSFLAAFGCEEIQTPNIECDDKIRILSGLHEKDELGGVPNSVTSTSSHMRGGRGRDSCALTSRSAWQSLGSA